MKKYVLPLLLISCTITRAQERLTMQDAILMALEHNYDIRTAEIAQKQAQRNNTLGNAGFSPVINAGVTASESHNNVRSDLANGSQQNNPNAKNTNVNPAVTANWTLFDGGRMFFVKKQLNEAEALSETQFRAQIQATVSKVIQTYAQVTLQQKQMMAIDTALKLAVERMKLAELKYRTGAGAKVDYLQARVDYNARQDDSVTYLNTFANACDSLSVLMGNNDGKLYKVDDSLTINLNLIPADMDRLKEINLSLDAYRHNSNISRLNADIAKTYHLPTLSFSGTYAYNRSTSATGFALFTRSYGINGLFNLSIPVFSGGNIRRQSGIASLQAMRDELLFERHYTIIGRQYRTAWRNYRLAIAAYNLARENISFARENIEVQAARFRVGIGTTLELREAENGYVQALVRLYTAQYNVKVGETQMLELENKLITRK